MAGPQMSFLCRGIAEIVGDQDAQRRSESEARALGPGGEGAELRQGHLLALWQISLTASHMEPSRRIEVRRP
jgi:hypothetical protein